MNKQFIFGGLVGGVIVWLLLRKKCPKCGNGAGGGKTTNGITPSVFVQNPIIAQPPPPSDILPAPGDGGAKTLIPLQFTGSGYTRKSWGNWVK